MNRTAMTIRDELVSIVLPDGRRALAVLPVIPEDAPYQVREGVARRRITVATGTCPCGATLDLAAAQAAGVTLAEVVHESRCPAVTDKMVKAIRRWLR